MARTETVKPDNGLIRITGGNVLDDAATPDAASIDLGFRPRYIRIVNITDRIEQEWFEGMASAASLQTVAAGTRTLEAATGPTLAADGKTIGFAVLQNKQYRWQAIG